MRHAIDIAYGVRNWVLPHWSRTDNGGAYSCAQAWPVAYGDKQRPESIPLGHFEKGYYNDGFIPTKNVSGNSCKKAIKQNAKPITFWGIATPLIVLAVKYFGEGNSYNAILPSTYAPTWEPTNSPTFSPSFSPTNHPSLSPTLIPTFSPTNSPTNGNTTCPELMVLSNAGEMYFIAQGSNHQLYFNFTKPDNMKVDLELNWLDTKAVRITPPAECESTQTSSKCNNVTGAVRFGIFGVRQGSNMIDDKISCNDELYEEQQTTYVVQ